MEVVMTMIECRYTGEVRPSIESVKVKKESEKLLRLEKTLKSKVQYYKSEMDYISKEEYSNSFSVWCIDINHGEEHVRSMMDKVMSTVTDMILKRKERIGQWEDGMAHDIKLL